MKRITLFALFLNAAFLFFIWRELAVVEGGGVDPCKTDTSQYSIDSNGDGEVDVADAVHLLFWLFKAGSEPPQVCLAEAGGGLTPEQAAILDVMSLVEIGGGGQVRRALNFRGVDNVLFQDANVLIPNGILRNEVLDDLDSRLRTLEADDLDNRLRTLEAGLIPLGTNADTGLQEYRHVQTGIELVLLPGGKFAMGSPVTETEPFLFPDERPVHAVTLDPFLLGKTEVTQGQYEAVMGSNPSHFTGDANRPVEMVSWDDLQAPGGFLARTGLSLPSEAQWEYAARSGTTTAFSFDSDCNLAEACEPCAAAESFMWWCGNAGGTTHPVGGKQPNAFGLHDMHGNVWEWCEDQYDPSFYARPEATGPNPVNTIPAHIERRVRRGGSVFQRILLCRSAVRSGDGPSERERHKGFRVAMPLP